MRRRALALLAGLIAFLTIAGAGTAYAVWSVRATAQIEARAASIGIGSTPPAGLDGVHYSWTPTTESGTVNAIDRITTTNNGSRPATVVTTVRLVSTDHDSGELLDPAYKPALGQDLKIRYSLLADPENQECTLAASAPPLNLGPGPHPPYPGYTASSEAAVGNGPVTPNVDPGDSVTVCVEVWLPGAVQSNYGPGQFVLEIETRLVYAEASTWQRYDVYQVTQTINPPPEDLFYSTPAARYNLLNYGTALGGSAATWRCVELQAGWTYPRGDFGTTARINCPAYPASNTNYGDWEFRLLRLTENGTPTNRYWINWSQNVNSSNQPTEPRWSIDASGRVIKASAVGTDAAHAEGTDAKQQWYLKKNAATGWFQIKNYSTGLCVERGPDSGLGDASAWSGHYAFVTATCDEGEDTQWFQFSIKGTPYPVPVLAMTCTITNWADGQDISWSKPVGYENEVRYRVYLDGSVVYSNDGFPPTRNGGTDITTAQGGYGYNQTVQLQKYKDWVKNASPGLHTIVVEQMIYYGEWYVVAAQTFERNAAPASDYNGIKVRCPA